MPRRAWKTEDSIHERNKLEKYYVAQRLGAEAVAEKMGWAVRTVYDRLAFHGLISGHRTPKYCPCCGHAVPPGRKLKPH